MPDNSETFVALRLMTLRRTPGFIAGSGARERLFAFHRRTEPWPRIHEVLPERAQLFVFEDPDVWFGGPYTIACLDRVPGDAGALDFLADALGRHAATLGPDTLIEVAVDDPDLVRLLITHGFAIDSVILVGDPAVAQRRLAKTAMPDGLTLRTLVPDDVPAVLDLHRTVFGAAPERCWFGAYPSHLERLGAALAKGRQGQFGLFKGDTLIGHAGADIQRKSSYWGALGGIELVLAPDFTGKGLARPLYSALLDVLVENTCETMKGGTNQPAVLHLGRVMRRPWHAFNLRRQSPYTLDHFLTFAPPDIGRRFTR